MTIKDITVKCQVCGKIGHMELDWDVFKLPKGWRYRTRAFNLDDRPDDIQIVCSPECGIKV